MNVDDEEDVRPTKNVQPVEDTLNALLTVTGLRSCAYFHGIKIVGTVAELFLSKSTDAK